MGKPAWLWREKLVQTLPAETPLLLTWPWIQRPPGLSSVVRERHREVPVGMRKSMGGNEGQNGVLTIVTATLHRR